MNMDYDQIVFNMTSSFRPVQSSVVGAFTNYFAKLLPENYFKEHNISTAIGISRNKENTKKPNINNKPNDKDTSSNIRLNDFPQFNIELVPSMESSQYDIGTEWYSNYHLRTNYDAPILEDYQGYKHIKASIDRTVINLNIQIIEDTESKGIELAKYLSRTMPFGRTVFLNDCVIAFTLPANLINTMANVFELNLSDGNHLEWLKTYLYNASNGSIRYVLDSGTGQHIFAFHYITNIVMQLPSETPNVSTERANKTVNYSEITFEVKLDLNTIPSIAYYQESSIDKGFDLRNCIGDTNTDHPYINIPVLALPPKQLTYDTNKFLQLVNYTSIITDDNKEKDDAIVNLADILPNFILKRWKEAPADKKEAILWYDYNEVNSEDYDFTDDMDLIIKGKFKRSNWQYRLALYIDTEMFTTVDWDKLKNTTPFT